MRWERWIAVTFVFVCVAWTGIAFAAPACPENDVNCWIGVLEKGDLKASLRAAMVLGKLGDPVAVDALIKKLGHKDKYMNTAASFALAKIGAPAMPALVAATKDKRSSVRKLAAHAIGQIGGEAYQVLADLTRDEDPAVRFRAFQALQTLKDKRSVAEGIMGLKDSHRNVRIEAIRLLGLLEDPRCVASLATFGLGDLSPEVSMEAAAALIHIGPESVDPLIAGFERQPDYAKNRTLFVLGELAAKRNGDDSAKANKFLLTVIAQPDIAVSVKQAAVSKLGDIGDPQAIPALQNLLNKTQGKPEFEELIQITVRTLEKLNRK